MHTRKYKARRDIRSTGHSVVIIYHGEFIALRGRQHLPTANRKINASATDIRLLLLLVLHVCGVVGCQLCQRASCSGGKTQRPTTSPSNTESLSSRCHNIGTSGSQEDAYDKNLAPSSRYCRHREPPALGPQWSLSDFATSSVAHQPEPAVERTPSRETNVRPRSTTGRQNEHCLMFFRPLHLHRARRSTDTPLQEDMNKTTSERLTFRTPSATNPSSTVPMTSNEMGGSPQSMGLRP